MERVLTLLESYPNMGIVDIEKGAFMKKNINGCELHYEIIGKGIPTICLHGFFVDKI